MKKYSSLTLAAAAWLFATGAHAGVKVSVSHAANDDATSSFRLNGMPAASATDAATAARFSIVEGTADDNGGSLASLHDGKLPAGDDSPGENFFFQAGTGGGRLLVDLGKLTNVKQVNTYSWHPSSRGPQVYKLYASDGTAEGFNAAPQKGTNPEDCGWKQVASVDTRSKEKNDESGNGGQYGVSISDTGESLGRYRYLLFEASPTETEDGFGNTFYSEIDVVDADAPPVAQQADEPAPATAPVIFKTADGKNEITIRTKEAPQLRGWAESKLAPALAEWYPKIVEMLPSEGYTAPTHFSITLEPMDGVAYTSGRRVVASSNWLENELNREAVGSLVHEAVHVAQQYNGHNPGWLVEGTADYIRWFKYEPQSHGADIVWMRRQHHFTPRYDGSYRITANFLNWVTEKYDAKIVGQMNAAMRTGKYDAVLWKEYTGKTVQELGEEWKKDIEAQLASPSGSADAK